MLHVALIGNENVGKTSLIDTYAGKSFTPEYVPTVFKNYTGTTVETKQRMTLYDSSGMTQYSALRPLGYPKIDVFILVFSVVDRASFTILPQWVSECQYHRPSTPFLLVGTKIDLPKRCVTIQEAETLMKSLGAQTYLECSAKTGKNVQHLFRCAIALGLRYKKPSNCIIM